MEKGQLIIRLKTAKALKDQDLKLLAMAQVLKSINSTAFDEYESIYQKLQAENEDLKEINDILASLRDGFEEE